MKIPITIGKGTDTAKRRSKAPPRRGNKPLHSRQIHPAYLNLQYCMTQETITQMDYELIIQILKKKSCCCYLTNDNSIRPQFCTCHNSSAVVTCANLWPDWIIRIIIIAKRIFTWFLLWAHKPFVNWTPGVFVSSTRDVLLSTADPNEQQIKPVWCQQRSISEEICQVPVPSQCWEMTENSKWKYSSMFSENNWA